MRDFQDGYLTTEPVFWVADLAQMLSPWTIDVYMNDRKGFDKDLLTHDKRQQQEAAAKQRWNRLAEAHAELQVDNPQADPAELLIELQAPKSKATEAARSDAFDRWEEEQRLARR